METFSKSAISLTWRSSMHYTQLSKELKKRELKQSSTSEITTYTANLMDECFIRCGLSEGSPRLWKNRHWFGIVFKWFLGFHLWIDSRKQSEILTEARDAVSSYIAVSKEQSQAQSPISYETLSSFLTFDIKNSDLCYCPIIIPDSVLQ